MVRRSITRRLSAAVGLGALACLSLSACSNSDGGDAKYVETSTNLDTEPILVGGLVDQSGAAGGQDLPGVMRAWAEWVNQNDGIGGHPVKLAIYDPKGDPTASLAAATELVEKKPSFIVLYSNADSAIGDFLSKSNIPVIGMGYNPTVWGGKIAASKTDLETMPNFFHIGTSQSSLGDMELLAGQQNGAKKVAVAACAEVTACAQIGPMFEHEADRIDMGYGGLFRISSSAPNYTSQCFEASKKGVDMFEMSVSHSTANRLVRDCLDQGYQGKFSAQGATPSTDMLPLKDAVITGALDSFPWWLETEAVQNFNKALKDAGVEDYRSSSVSSVWASLELARKASESIEPSENGPSSADMLAALYQVKDEDLGGLLPQKLTFTEGEPSPYVNCAWTFRFENGEFASNGDDPAGILCDEDY